MVERAKPVIANATVVISPESAGQSAATNLPTTYDNIEMMMTTRTMDIGRDGTKRCYGALLKPSVDPKHGNLPW